MMWLLVKRLSMAVLAKWAVIIFINQWAKRYRK